MTDYEPSFKAYERLAPLDPSARPVAVTVPWEHVLRFAASVRTKRTEAANSSDQRSAERFTLLRT